MTIFICGGGPGIAEIGRRNVNAKVGREMIVGTCAPSKRFDENPKELEAIISAINDSGATVLLVGLGGGRQEKFIFKYRDRLPKVTLFLPLGGTIDYEAETLKRPPAWVTDAGLEWFYRVALEPRQRWRRYLLHQPVLLCPAAGRALSESVCGVGGHHCRRDQRRRDGVAGSPP